MKQYKPKNKKKSIRISAENESIHVIEQNACGIDVGAASVFVCVPRERDTHPIREYTTFTADLRSMAEWIKQCGITTIVMESTGVYWIPVFEILDEYKFEVKLVNAHHVRNVPGRKTDVSDAEWLQRLHSYGLLNGSFRPADHVVKLRSYVRHRSSLMQRGADQLNYAQKALEQLNIKLGHVVSDISGLTGTRIIEDILQGNHNPKKLALHRDGRCKESLETIEKALEGNWREEHILSLKHAWEMYKYIHQQIVECEQAIEKLIDCFEKKKLLEDTKKTTKAAEKRVYNKSPYCFDMRNKLHSWSGVDLCTIPGINENLATKILSEIGTDMTRWKSVKHFCSWLAVCPGNKISGGKRLSGRTKPSKNRAREALGMAAQALTYSDSYLGAYYRRMRSKVGAPKANRAASHKIAKIIYTMLKEEKEYTELGASVYEELHKERTLRNIESKAKKLGYILVPIAA